ncbi:hypothetical protein D1007_18219 [Hordeum vulgare]|nr:hypothetical protein D1007_18219 [Hordeum vulgare]
MEDLPEPLLADIITRITMSSDLNSLCLVSKRLCAAEAEHRGAIRVGCGVDPRVEALTSLFSWFSNLWKSSDDGEVQAQPVETLPRGRDGGTAGAMLQEFAEIRAAQGKLSLVDGICEQLAPLNTKLSEHTVRLDQVQMKVNLSCDTLVQVQQQHQF